MRRNLPAEEKLLFCKPPMLYDSIIYESMTAHTCIWSANLQLEVEHTQKDLCSSHLSTPEITRYMNQPSHSTRWSEFLTRHRITSFAEAGEGPSLDPLCPWRSGFTLAHINYRQ